MLIDARSIESGRTLDADVCIVGAGPAGITLALEFIDRGAKVILLESGGSRLRQTTQDLHKGTVTGRPYYELHNCRLRFLGGSSNFWGGWCRPLDDIDFESRDWVPNSGWPFRRRDLERYYERAQQICDLGPYDYSPEQWQSLEQTTPLKSHSDVLSATLFQICPTRFGQRYQVALKRATNVNLMLHANALEILLDQSQQTVTHVQVGTLSGNRFRVTARTFVLAAGGIENPRILLASQRQWRTGLGNQNDLVGRFFTDHFHVPFGMLAHADSAAVRFYSSHRVNGVTVRGALSLSEDLHRKEQLLGFAVTLHDRSDPHDVLSPENNDLFSARQFLARSFRRGERSEQYFRRLRTVLSGLNHALTVPLSTITQSGAGRLTVGCRAEQVPNRDSRVILDSIKDCFDMPRVKLDWRSSEQDFINLERARRIVSHSIAMKAASKDQAALTNEKINAAAHHMGTTRMHRDPKMGVVDENCRVHGIGNLYISGSSVFPTGGWAPPTLTIVALSVRLAEHLKHLLT